MKDELHWLAFRYVTGEMTADEEDRFEAQLADDQAAREAVEQAIELHEAIRLAAADTAREDVELAAAETTRLRVRHATRHRLAWVASLAALLMLSLMGLFRLVSTTAPRPPADGGIAAEPGAAVARTWVEVRQAQQENIVADPSVLAASEVEVGELTETASVPKWMMTAFAKQPKQK